MYGLKLTGQHQEVVLRKSLHNIAAVMCCEDEDVWYLFIKTGDPGVPATYECHVCECALMDDAVEICKMIKGTLDEAFRKARPMSSIPAVVPQSYNGLTVLSQCFFCTRESGAALSSAFFTLPRVIHG